MLDSKHVACQRCSLANDEMQKDSEMVKTRNSANAASNHSKLQKCSTGIKGFDEITEGGLLKNRITLVSGGSGSGKTLLGIDFLVNGVINYKEPGVFMSFEETEDEIYQDVALMPYLLNSIRSGERSMRNCAVASSNTWSLTRISKH